MPKTPTKPGTPSDANTFAPVKAPAASRLSLRERTLARKSLQKEHVVIELDGETYEYVVRKPSSRVKWAVEQTGFNPDGDQILPVEAFPLILISMVEDPESGELLFDEGDEDAVGEMDTDLSTPLVRAGLRLLFPPASGEGSVGNSSEGQAAPGSASASTSASA